MTTVGDILSFMETLAPAAMKMDWDNAGLLLGSKSTPVTKILVALDPFEGVAEEAIGMDAQLIVTHHPLLFHPARQITDETSIGRTIMKLCRSGISAINAHTNLDCADGGVNDVLAQTLGLSDVSVIGQEHLLRAGQVNAMPLEAFLSLVKEKLGCGGLRYVDGRKTVQRVCVGGGSCAGEMLDALRAGCDTFVTADVKYNQFWDARDLELNLIDAGHFHTENPVCAVLAKKIREAFPEIQVEISKNHTDPMKFF